MLRRRPCGRAAHDSGTVWLARPLPYGSFIRNISPVWTGARNALLVVVLCSIISLSFKSTSQAPDFAWWVDWSMRPTGTDVEGVPVALSTEAGVTHRSSGCWTCQLGRGNQGSAQRTMAQYSLLTLTLLEMLTTRGLLSASMRLRRARSVAFFSYLGARAQMGAGRRGLYSR